MINTSKLHQVTPLRARNQGVFIRPDKTEKGRCANRSHASSFTKKQRLFIKNRRDPCLRYCKDICKGDRSLLHGHPDLGNLFADFDYHIYRIILYFEFGQGNEGKLAAFR